MVGLKAGRRRSDPPAMPTLELTCPICQADVPLSGDEKPGEEVACTYCGAPCRISGRPDEDPKEWELEEDF
jgi:DNA-directed RNA polymerase subunit RPC12/RpoP